MTSGFEILPAIDLRGGRVVRLEQGDFARETAFSSDPVAVARASKDRMTEEKYSRALRLEFPDSAQARALKRP